MNPAPVPHRRRRFCLALALLMLVVAGSVLICMRLESSAKLRRYSHRLPHRAGAEKTDQRTLLRQARQALQKRQYEVAKKDLDAILAESPGNPDAWHLLGILYYRQGAYRQAENAFRYLLRQRPESIGGRNNLAHALWRQGRRSEAETEVQEALQLAPDDTAVLLTATVFAAEQGDDVRAKAFLERALRSGATPEMIARDPRLERFVARLAKQPRTMEKTTDAAGSVANGGNGE